jgi:ABC-type phosphate/phosphonate transport system substrate-binding protein
VPAAAVLAVAGVTALAAALRGDDGSARGPAAPVRVGLSRTLFRDAPEPLFAVMARPFARLVADRAGAPGELALTPDAVALADRLGRGELDLAVFHGFELAWARQRFPGLRPLVVAVTRRRRPAAVVVARADRPGDGFAALQGRTVAVPKGTKEYCRLFLDRRGPHGAADPHAFGRVTEPANVEDALDDVVDGQADAALVDGTSLDCYRSLKPARAAKLKEAVTSDPFPAAAVACRGGLDGAVLERVRQGLLAAGQTRPGARVLSLWQLEAFEAPPADYDEQLAESLRAYPPPAGAVAPR